MTDLPPGDSSKSGRKRRLLLRVESISRRRPKTVFAVVGLLVVAALIVGSRMRLESDVLELIPRGNPRIDAFRDALRDFGAIDYLLVLIELDGAADDADAATGGRSVSTGALDDLEDFADTFAEILEERDAFVEDVEYRFRLDDDLLELFYDNALLFLPPEKLPELAGLLEGDRIDRRLRDNRLVLATPASGFAESLLASDPLGLLPLFLNRLVGSRGALEVDLSDGYYLSKEGDTLIMLVKPTGPSQDLEFDRRLLATVRAAEAEARAEIEAANGVPPPLRVRYGGNYALALEESALIKRDIGRNLWVSLTAVVLLYWLCYRRVAALLYSSVPLLVGQAWTFALGYLALRQLNAASSSFTALLMGLGTDFTIVMYARYVEERRAGRSLAEATEKMVGETGLGVFTGAITSAGTFLAMCVSGFRGLFDLGFLIGFGILLCAVAIVLLLPAMISWNEGMRKRRSDPAKRLHLQSFGLEHLIPIAARHRAPTIVLVAVAAIASGFYASGIEFDDSINALRSNATDASRVQADVAERFGASLSYMMAIVEARSVDAAIDKAAVVEERLGAYLAERPELRVSYDSVLSYLPPRDQQLAVLAALAADDARHFDPERVRVDFERALDANGFRRDAYADYLDRMERFLSPTAPLEVSDLTDRGLDRLVDRYIHKSGDGVRVVTYLYPADARFKRVAPPGLTQALSRGDPSIVVTGTNVVGTELRRLFSREAVRAVGLGLALVTLLLLVDFRSVRLTAVAMAQLVAGIAMMFGAMRLLDVELNYVNAFVATMMLGVGIDYSIHLVHRLHWNDGRIEDGLLETGKAVVVAALTNIAGFGTLTLGHYPALRSFGLVALIGSATCLLTALTLVPALMVRRAQGGRAVSARPAGTGLD